MKCGGKPGGGNDARLLLYILKTYFRKEPSSPPAPFPFRLILGLEKTNLLSVIFAQVYYPCHSNGLKEIAKHLGFRWSASTATGMGTIVGHQEWESSRAAAAKEALLIYNAEDCQALEVVLNCLLELCRVSSQIGDSPSGDVVNTAHLKWEHPYGFKKKIRSPSRNWMS